MPQLSPSRGRPYLVTWSLRWGTDSTCLVLGSRTELILLLPVQRPLPCLSLNIEVRTLVGRTTYERHLTQGAAMNGDEAVTYALEQLDTAETTSLGPVRGT
jgi:hypothetical protein